ncbi:MAG: type II toxin-antitoxin system RelE/ParE family toxin [Epsilonproteobacteria bacterium]|nr:type II toxin-antitoxin system RelE/ParE family toxin [Campylobacterota bacterium]PIP11555.1 MAG: plasmid stabilization protein [Sulfurimonas sp. CG23_combo_of_CG06-09_8_20_14_all_36_33]PIS25925.1 MAG: plasmid stabilization protein [Sulfurimonas sp. CG08_land_8_20_14_0_20_36_33]PIU35811.1 MAG: plasmid stabilization protein [Sulfurimonas sp. CG07_land_8_20_14_0_80_36_56]PIV02690.1 MAG: plasmid stabilization protein [Sulfurimonas sp. CG03_land_8_20_14_0_80_36_25]PIV36979.1 MAG: plasmid stabil
MQIIRDTNYLQKLQSIMEYIAQDSVNQALKFQVDLDEIIHDIPDMPFKYKKSIYFNDKNIRDLVFKGYVVPYKIDPVKNQIIIIGINKYMEKLK